MSSNPLEHASAEVLRAVSALGGRDLVAAIELLVQENEEHTVTWFDDEWDDLAAEEILGWSLTDLVQSGPTVAHAAIDIALRTYPTTDDDSTLDGVTLTTAFIRITLNEPVRAERFELGLDHLGEWIARDVMRPASPRPADPAGWLVPLEPSPLEGGEELVGTDATVGDFWRWAYSDLRDNTLRGVLAEFLVASALGRTAKRRTAWDNYDVESATGIRVEVKASGYLQAWRQAKHSALNFGRVAARAFDEETNEFGAEPEVRADVFVFAVQTCKDHAQYNPLDIEQWRFYVVAAGPIRDSGHKTLGIGWVARHAEPITYATLAEEIESVHAQALADGPSTD